VQAVVNSYLDFVNETHRSTSKDILQILTQQKQDIDRQLAIKEAQLLALQQEGGVLTLQDDKTNVVVPRIMALSQSLTQARTRRMELESNYGAFSAATEKTAPVEAYLKNSLDKLPADGAYRESAPKQQDDPALREDVRKEMMQNRLELQRLTGMYG